MLKNVKKLYYDEEGADVTEYALLVGLLAAVCAGIVLVLGKQIKLLFEYILTKIQEAK